MCYLLRWIALLTIWICVLPAPPQLSTKQTSVQRLVVGKQDEAVKILQKSLISMGCGNRPIFTDYQIAATTKIWNGKEEALRLTLTGRVSGETRLEISGPPEQSRTLVTDQSGRSYATDKSAQMQPIPRQSALSRGTYFPLTYLYAALANNDLNIAYKGVSVKNGTQYETVEIAQVLGDSAANQLLSLYTKRTLYFDRESGQLARIDYSAYSTSNAEQSIDLHIEYKDYRLDGNFSIPHEIEEFRGNQLLKSITVNRLVPDISAPASYFIAR